MDLVTMDILSGLPTATDGSKHILVIVDAFTKWVEALPIADQEAATCMNAAYKHVFSRFGLPRQLHSDQGRNFESSLVKELCTLAGVYKTRTTPFHPRSDGLTERANRTILQMLRTTTTDHPRDWPDRLPALLSAYRMTEHSATHNSPNFAMLGREVLLPSTLIATPPEENTSLNTDYVTNFRATLREAHQQIRNSLGATARTEKRYFDKRVKYHSFSVGQLVWLYWPRPLIRKEQRKLTQIWSGPWEILQFFSPLVVQIRHTKNHNRQTVHVDRLSPCSVNGDTSPVTDPVMVEHQSAESGNAEVEVEVQVPLSVVERPKRRIRKPARYR